MALSVEQFLANLSESELIASDELQSFLGSHMQQRPPKDGEQLARELVKHKKLTKYQAEQVYSGRGKALVLGNYIAIEKLGQGGMGVVLKARHKRLKRLVALKVLAPHLVKTTDALKRFHREVEAAAKLRHPNIVATDDADEAKGIHFLVMEYVEGRDLAAWVKTNGPFDVQQSLTYILQAARGLEYAHKQGVIHRDIKPANLLLDNNGTVKVLDMGLARIAGEGDEHSQLTSTGVVMGTVDYMAPEQAMSTKNADERSDIYSLGLSLWNLLTGRCAYEGDTLMAKLLAHRNAPIPSISGLSADITPEHDRVFQKMIAKEAKDRYQSMTEVIQDIEQLVYLDTTVTKRSSVESKAMSQSSTAELSRNLGPSPTPAAYAVTEFVSSPVNSTQDSKAEHATSTIPQSEVQTLRGSTTESLATFQARGRRKPKPKTWYTDPRMLIAGAGALLLIAVPFLMIPHNGKLRAVILDKEATLRLKGTSVSFGPSDTEPIAMEPGEKRFVVKRGDIEFETKAFAVRKGQETQVRVELVGENLVVKNEGKVIGERPLAKRVPAAGQRDPSGTIVSNPPAVRSDSSKPPKAPVIPAVLPEGAPGLAVAPFNAEQASVYQTAWAEFLGVPVTFENSIGMTFLLIPPGEFTMGLTEAEVNSIDILNNTEDMRVMDKQRQAQSSPAHQVRISRAFYMQKYEVNVGQYQKVMGTLPANNDPSKPEMPVMANVKITDAITFCNKLSLLEEKTPAYETGLARSNWNIEANGYRLPTEAEWEYACRAGTTTMWFFPTEPVIRTMIPELLHQYQTIKSGSSAKPNSFGLYDMLGSSNEWCFDNFRPYKSEFVIDPFEPPEVFAVARGGSDFAGGGGDPREINSAFRHATQAEGNDFRYAGLGRLVLPIQQRYP